MFARTAPNTSTRPTPSHFKAKGKENKWSKLGLLDDATDLKDDQAYLDNLVELVFRLIDVAAVLLFVGPAGLVLVVPRAMEGIHNG